MPSPALDEMKAAKYTGTFADLNIYTTMMQNNLLGCDPQAYSSCPVTRARLWHCVPMCPASCGKVRDFAASDAWRVVLCMLPALQS